jgi:hypothetical protein
MMTEAVVHIKIKAPYIEQMLAKINNFLLSDSDKLEIIVEHPIEPDMDAIFKQVMLENDELNRRLA